MRFQNLWSAIKTASPFLLVAACSFTAIAQEVASQRPVLDFDGNKVFSKQELLDVANRCLDDRTASGAAYETEQLDSCLQRVVRHMQQKGYLKATLGKTLYNQSESVLTATIPVEEGPLYRVGEIKIADTKVLSPAQILDLIGLMSGDVADGDKLSAAIFEKTKVAYDNLGYIRYTAEISPTFHSKEGTAEGIVDFQISIEEGPQFRLRSIKFAGADDKTAEMLRRELLVRDGDIYNPDLFAKSITRINNTGLYAPVDRDRDVDYRINDNRAYLDLTIRLKKRAAPSVAANP